jgi:hypothetical protein
MALTPKAKLNCIFSSFKMIDSTFALFSSDESNASACADDML